MKKKRISKSEFLRRRNLAIASLDINVFKEFYKEMVELGVYKSDMLPSDEVIEISIRKMACEITTMPMELKLKASEWLMSRGYKPFVFDVNEGEKDNVL